MAFGAYIRQQREAQGIAMNDFARRLDISPAYWSRIEREMEKPPKDALIRKAAEILGLDPGLLQRLLARSLRILSPSRVRSESNSSI